MMARSFNPLEHPILFSYPRRLLAFSPHHEEIPLAMLLVDLLRPQVVVELGTYYAETFCAICQAAQELRLSARAFAYGSWLVDLERDPNGKHVLADLRAHQDALYSEISQLREIGEADVDAELGASGIDLLHVIGDRPGIASSIDPAAWLPKLSNRGVIWLEGVTPGSPETRLAAFRRELELQYPRFALGDAAGTIVSCVGREAPQAMLDLAHSPDVDDIRNFLSFLGQSRGEEQRARGLTAKALKQQAAIIKLQLRVEGLVREKAIVEEERAWLRDVICQMQATRTWNIATFYWRLHAGLMSRIRPASGRLAGKSSDAATGSTNAPSGNEPKTSMVVDSETLSLKEATEAPSVANSIWNDLSALISDCENRFNRAPSFLDWNTGLNVASGLSAPVATFSSTEPALPHLDHSIDIVLVPAYDSAWIAEAKRVARLAVVRTSGLKDRPVQQAGGPSSSNPVSLGAVEWLLPVSGPAAPSISIVLAVPNDFALAEQRVRALAGTLPGNFSGECVVVGQVGGRRLSSMKAEVPIKLVERQPDSSAAARYNQAAQVAAGEVLVFLGDDAVPSTGWIGSLLRIFREHQDVGAVGGKVCDPSGRVLSAGALVCADGSLLQIGSGDTLLTHPLYNFVREIDACPGAFMATTQGAFTSAGGFDPTYETIDYAFAEYGFRIVDQGCRVLYQPEIEAIASASDGLGGEEASQEIKSTQDRAKFAERWSLRLQGRPPVPKQLDRATWYRLGPLKAI